MLYAMLIYDAEQSFHGLPEAEKNAVYGQYMAFGQKYGAKIRGGEELKPTTTATTIRVRDGKTLTTDGPFAETKEQLGGFYLIEADNLDEAIAIGSEIPSATVGSIEIRPVNPH